MRNCTCKPGAKCDCAASQKPAVDHESIHDMMMASAKRAVADDAAKPKVWDEADWLHDPTAGDDRHITEK
jgi:hypothetical protein